MGKRRLLVAVIIVLAIALGACREFIFVNLNYQIDHLQRGTEFSYAHSAFQKWVSGSGASALVASKWGLTLFFIGIMMTMALFLARIQLSTKRYDRPVIAGTVLLTTIALVFHLSGYHALQVVGVKALHLLQYPIALLFIVLSSQLVRQA